MACGSICSHCLKKHFSNVKKIQTKISGVPLRNVFSHKKVSGRKTFLCGLCKKDKIMSFQILSSSAEICLFYTGCTKCFFMAKLFSWVGIM